MLSSTIVEMVGYNCQVCTTTIFNSKQTRVTCFSSQVDVEFCTRNAFLSPITNLCRKVPFIFGVTLPTSTEKEDLFPWRSSFLPSKSILEDDLDHRSPFLTLPFSTGTKWKLAERSDPNTPLSSSPSFPSHSLNTLFMHLISSSRLPMRAFVESIAVFSRSVCRNAASRWRKSPSVMERRRCRPSLLSNRSWWRWTWELAMAMECRVLRCSTSTARITNLNGILGFWTHSTRATLESFVQSMQLHIPVLSSSVTFLNLFSFTNTKYASKISSNKSITLIQ